MLEPFNKFCRSLWSSTRLLELYTHYSSYFRTRNNSTLLKHFLLCSKCQPRDRIKQCDLSHEVIILYFLKHIKESDNLLENLSKGCIYLCRTFANTKEKLQHFIQKLNSGSKEGNWNEWKIKYNTKWTSQMEWIR